MLCQFKCQEAVTTFQVRGRVRVTARGRARIRVTARGRAGAREARVPASRHHLPGAAAVPVQHGVGTQPSGARALRDGAVQLGLELGFRERGRDRGRGRVRVRVRDGVRGRARARLPARVAARRGSWLPRLHPWTTRHCPPGEG